LVGKVVAIDPGHNGNDWAHSAEISQPVPAGGFTKACDETGTQTAGGYTESAFNLDVALRLGDALRRLGATVVLTRTTDSGVGPCVNQRAAIGNQAHAKVAISIHADGGPVGGRGFEVIQPALITGFTAAIVTPSHQLALDVRDAYAASTGMPTANYIGVNGLDTRADLGGLNLSTVPKVFIECGNMQNATDASMLSDPSFRQRAADGISHAIRAYLAR
jgi:N-acetylmuramoyl-L-alanine amidase